MHLIPHSANLTMVLIKDSDRNLADLFHHKEPPTLATLMKFTKVGMLGMMRIHKVWLINNSLMTKELLFKRILIVWAELHILCSVEHERLIEVDLAKDLRVMIVEGGLDIATQ
jgi:hypothetical protein